jgi:trypsin-like peptidase/ZZ type zinc finger protein
MTRDPKFVHLWSRCAGCGIWPLAGRRYECQNCPAGPDNDLCEECYRLFERGFLKHPSPESYAAASAGTSHTFVVHEGYDRENYLPWLAVPQPEEEPPSVPDKFVIRPEFRCGRESFFGSYGFVVESENSGRPLVITALHVMDELARAKHVDCSARNTAYTGSELPALVTKIFLYDVFAPNWMMAELGAAGPMLVLPDARIGDEEPYSQRDIAVFHANDLATKLSPLKLAASSPEVGEPIWLASRREGGASGRTFAAVVVERTERTLIFRFGSTLGMPRYTSGAPLLNSRGEVVGINVGAGCLDGQILGHANHVESIRRHCSPYRNERNRSDGLQNEWVRIWTA